MVRDPLCTIHFVSSAQCLLQWDLHQEGQLISKSQCSCHATLVARQVTEQLLRLCHSQVFLLPFFKLNFSHVVERKICARIQSIDVLQLTVTTAQLTTVQCWSSWNTGQQSDNPQLGK